MFLEIAPLFLQRIAASSIVISPQTIDSANSQNQSSSVSFDSFNDSVVLSKVSFEKLYNFPLGGNS